MQYTTNRYLWPCTKAKHRWIEARLVNDNWSITKETAQFLVPIGAPAVAAESYSNAKWRELDDESGLFLEFARLSPTEEAILDFANRYGSLTLFDLALPVDVKARLPLPPKGSFVSYATFAPSLAIAQEAIKWQKRWFQLGARSGDSLERWQQNIQQMSWLVRLWNAVSVDDTSALEQLLKQNGGGSKLTRAKSRHPRSAQGSQVVSAKKHDVKQKALVLLRDSIGERTSSATSNGGSLARVGDNWVMVTKTKSLLDATWLQFGLAILHNKTYRDCEVCGKPFEISPEVHRTNRTLCSSTCKSRAHRMRRYRALELAASGLSPSQIAKRVGSQLTTVKKWLFRNDG